MLWHALRNLEAGSQSCLSPDNAASLTGGWRTYWIGLIADIVRPSRATLLRRAALRAARKSRSAGNE